MRINEVAPENPSEDKQSGMVWLLNLEMIESNTGRVIEKIMELDSNVLSVTPFDEGNVLYSKLRPYLNKVVIPDGKGYATTELIPLRPNPKKLNKVFFSHLLRSDAFVNYANSIATGTKMPRMPIGDLRKFKCILPPLFLQEQFASIAHQADKSEFGDSKSQFIEMFGEKEKNIKNGVLGDFCSLKAGKSVKAEDIGDDYCDGLYPCYGGNGLRGYVSSYSHEGVFNIIGRQGALCGNVTITSNRFYATEHAVVVTPKEEVNTYWLFYALKELNLNQYARGVAQPGLAVNQLEKIPFGVPSLTEQDRFETLYKQADKSEYELRSEIDAIDNDIKSFINENMKRIEYRYTLGKNTFIIMDGSICKVNPIFV